MSHCPSAYADSPQTAIIMRKQLRLTRRHLQPNPGNADDARPISQQALQLPLSEQPSGIANTSPPTYFTLKPNNGSSSSSNAAGSQVYAAAGCIAQSPIGRSAEQLRGTMKFGLPRRSGVLNRRVQVKRRRPLHRQILHRRHARNWFCPHKSSHRRPIGPIPLAKKPLIEKHFLPRIEQPMP